MATNNIKVTITTPDGVFFEGDAPIVSLKTAAGYIGLQANRTPLFSNVEIGKLIIGWENSDDSIKCWIGGGIVYADSEKVNIITEDILNVKDIDVARAQRDVAEIRQKMNSNIGKESSIELSKLEIKLKKALNRVDTYNQFNNK
ncbi:FoF1 ATP synthase subunit delta/epsilon [Mycoplasma buteonis]|uniref:FoF1 ATP synthase subunit delta/epsilon n=1 Tax=Mycoplasma buteonis TaxID=171280 RepID=UPI00056C4653|nr:F0F1 ATP synthase subunit epsilon [Mycoplasma buteonis]